MAAQAYSQYDLYKTSNIPPSALTKDSITNILKNNLKSTKFSDTVSCNTYSSAESLVGTLDSSGTVIGPVKGMVVGIKMSRWNNVIEITANHPIGRAEISIPGMEATREDTSSSLEPYIRQMIALLSMDDFSMSGGSEISSLLTKINTEYAKKITTPKDPKTTQAPDTLMSILLSLTGVDPNTAAALPSSDNLILNDEYGQLFIIILSSLYQWKSTLDSFITSLTKNDLLHQYCDPFNTLSRSSIDSNDIITSSQLETIKDFVVSQSLSGTPQVSNLFYNPPVKNTIFEILDGSGDTRESVLGNILSSNTLDTTSKILTHAIVGKSTDIDNITKDTITKITNKITASKKSIYSIIKAYPVDLISHSVIGEEKKYFASFKKIVSQATV